MRELGVMCFGARCKILNICSKRTWTQSLVLFISNMYPIYPIWGGESVQIAFIQSSYVLPYTFPIYIYFILDAIYTYIYGSGRYQIVFGYLLVYNYEPIPPEYEPLDPFGSATPFFTCVRNIMWYILCNKQVSCGTSNVTNKHHVAHLMYTSVRPRCHSQ